MKTAMLKSIQAIYITQTSTHKAEKRMLWFLHVMHQKADEFMDVRGTMQSPHVVGQSLQHIKALWRPLKTLFT